jgi:hypothetical protein
MAVAFARTDWFVGGGICLFSSVRKPRMELTRSKARLVRRSARWSARFIHGCENLSAFLLPNHLVNHWVQNTLFFLVVRAKHGFQRHLLLFSVDFELWN